MLYIALPPPKSNSGQSQRKNRSPSRSRSPNREDDGASNNGQEDTDIGSGEQNEEPVLPPFMFLLTSQYEFMATQCGLEHMPLRSNNDRVNLQAAILKVTKQTDVVYHASECK